MLGDKMKTRSLSYIAIAAIVGPLAAFLWFAHAADQVLDKHGNGDIAQNIAYNQSAGISFYIAVVVSIAVVAMSVWKRGKLGA